MWDLLPRTEPVRPEDEPFLYDVYASTRADELAAWGWDIAQAEAFLRMQFNARTHGYEHQFPDAEHRIIWHEGQRVGQVMVRSGERTLDLIDLALLPQWRGKGLGTAFLLGFQAHAAAVHKILLLHVLKTNRARHLYERLGFVVTGDDGMYYAMEWRP